MKIWLCMAALLGLVLAGCTRKPGREVAESPRQPVLYPDYCDVTIPRNIAPMNFLVREPGCEAVQIEVEREGTGTTKLTLNANGNEAVFGMRQWRRLMDDIARRGGDETLRLTVTVLAGGRWTRYRPFCWRVVADEVDPILTYRLIEPDYEVWSNVEIVERCVENFDERPLSTFRKVGDRCMNCHTFAAQDPRLSMLYVRGEGGGAILNRDGQLSKLDLKAPDMVSGSVYFGFSPTGRYVVFSSNVIIPAFHAVPAKRLEVFDSKSDVYVADLQTHTFLHAPQLADSLKLETFPTFSPDGKYIYYCSADTVLLPQHVRRLQYRLCRVAFDEATGIVGTDIERLPSVPGRNGQTSVCHPRISPDGRYLLYTVADYGTFPIWHVEADLQMMDLATGEVKQLEVANSRRSDTYHSWSSNSRWFVFASKRDDGLYGKPYFCYVDRDGKVHKPFCLPQKDPTRYDNMLKSMNAPEMGRGTLPFTADDVERAMRLAPQAFSHAPARSQ